MMESHWIFVVGLIFHGLVSEVTGQVYYDYPEDLNDYYSNPGAVFQTGSEFCKQKSSCDASMTSYPDKSCYCDDICSITSDCCQGFTPTIHQSLSFSLMTCISKPEVMRNSEFGFLMVDKCDSDTNIPEAASRCENRVNDPDITLQLPVTSNQTQLVYKNMYCAFCNNEFDILHWHVQILCLNDVKTVLPQTFSNCTFYFWPPREIQNARKCPNRLVVDSCAQGFGNNVDENEIRENCSKNDVDYVYVKTAMYKNKYCAMCNSFSEEDIYCDQQEFELTTSGAIQPRYSFRVLIDLNSNQAERQNSPPVDLPISCHDDQLFDPYTNECRTIYCFPPRIPSRGKCVFSSSILTALTNNTGLNCTYVKYTPTEYRFINESAVFIKSSEKVYNTADIYLVDTNVFICADKNQTCQRDCMTSQIIFDFDETEQILSTVTLIISAVSLATTFIVYVSFPVLLNTPGKILVCLIISLFFAQVTFLFAEVAEASRTACIIIAVAVHLFYLSAFCWVNIIALDLWMTFSKQFISAGSESKSSKRMYFYGLYAWGCPLLIIITALIVDNVDVGDKFQFLQPMYGDPVCWIGSSHAMLLFFVGPAGLSQLFNIVSFVFTSYHIAKASKHGARARGQAKSCTLLIIVKLSLIMGLTWVFAVVASMVDSLVTWYIFICLNGLQGLYICICFVCTKKVIRLLKDRVVEISSKTRTSSTQMTSVDKSTEKNR